MLASPQCVDKVVFYEGHTLDLAQLLGIQSLYISEEAQQDFEEMKHSKHKNFFIEYVQRIDDDVRSTSALIKKIRDL